MRASGSVCTPPVWQGKSGTYFEASAHVEFHFRYRAEQDELQTSSWKHKVSFRKTHFLLRTTPAVTKTRTITMLFRYLQGHMNGAFKMGKLALGH